jgi:hypothetical protein
MQPSHVVLLGDSILDNGAYAGGGPDVAAQLRGELPDDWTTTLLAEDGAVTADVVRQLRKLPPTADRLVISVGGNDALGYSGLLSEEAGTVSGALAKLAAAQDSFSAGYSAMAAAVGGLGLPASVCTIYDTPASAPNQRIIRTALAVFNDSITRAAFAAGFSVIDLRVVCDDDGDYANTIEPSVQGGGKIARAVAASLLRGQP